MKKTIGILGILLITFSATALAGTKPATAITAKLAYQEGLFFQRTIGNLEKALKSYDRALKAATDAEHPGLLESILLRRAECFKLLGRDNQQQTVIAALHKETKATTAQLGSARFFPPESDMIMQVDLAALLSAPLLEKLNVKAEINFEELEQVTKLLGFDPLRDLHKLTVGVTLSDSETMPAEHWLIHAEGKLSGFRPDRLIESGEQLAPGVLPKTRKIHGANVLVMKVPLPKEQIKVMTIGVAFLGDGGILAGDLKVLKSALAARAGKAPGLSANPKLARLTGQVPENSTFWLAGVPTQIIKKLQKMEHLKIPGLPKNLPEVAGLMLSGRITEDFEAVGLAFTEDLESARLLGDIFKGALALAMLVPVDEPLVQKLLGSLRVETKDREVKVSITLPGELIAPKKPCCPDKKVEKRRLQLKVGEERKLGIPGMTGMLVDDSDVVDAKRSSADRLVVSGKKAGQTKLTIQRKGKPKILFKISVAGAAGNTISKTLRMVVGEQKELSIPKVFKVATSDHKVIDVRTTGSESFKIIAKSAGQTTMTVMREGKQTIWYKIIVSE